MSTDKIAELKQRIIDNTDLNPVIDDLDALCRLYESGKDRLVMPGFTPGVAPDPIKEKPDGEGGGGGGGGGGKLALDPLLIELLKKIPPTKDKWPEAQRLRWFRTFAMNVSHVYDDTDKPVDIKIELEPAK